ncbi:MAG: CRISPR-associated helicase Cas3', partial [Spirochaetia bacterium]|nr:CRISPR-associated helicase Cas3' [Spirochaetota bacterium]MDW8113254.1 CRISPR-associated helicase Cas3' [Spirochaetia bacterium]
MSSGMLSNILSHPEKHLEEHINGCLRHFREEVSKLNLDEKLLKAIEILIVCHDIGKATSYFQGYIRGGERNQFTNHSLLSSVFAYYITKNLLNDTKLAVYNFVACKNHHSDLWNSKEEDVNFLMDELTIVSQSISPNPDPPVAVEYLKKQLDSIDFEEFHKFVSNLDVSEDVKSALMVSKGQVEEWIESIEGELMELKGTQIIEDELMKLKATQRIEDELMELKAKQRILQSQNGGAELTDIPNCVKIYGSIEDYFTFLLMFSSLVYSDKKDAILPIDFDFKLEYLEADEKIVEKYKETIKTNYNINAYREKAYNEVLNTNIQELLEDGKRFFSITLPTGMGKTLTGFAFALKLRDFLKKSGRGEYKIVYSLPFLSIIDQNFDVIERVLKENGIHTTSDNVVKHHHLSELKYRINGNSKDNYLDTEISKLFIETWETNIVITTFIQLFLSIITNSNSSSRRFIKLAKSIIILDEVQTIPYKYWDVIRGFFERYAEKFDVYIVFMTATQPKILPTFELVRDKDYYFTKLDRIEVSYDSEEMTIDEFLGKYGYEIQRYLEYGKKILFICNTIRSSKELYKSLSETFDNYSITYLSSYVIPKHRLERIREIRDREYDILVSTQVVEAGVDIDFDVVYRDFAPIDSIIQSSGRCNRNAKKDKGILKVVHLVYETSKDGEGEAILRLLKYARSHKSIFSSKKPKDRMWYASLIYDYLLLQCTERV